ncbi:hypothetical protein CY35_13G068400 [Sphagnum magellanicum]|nr:hypothetical protein CY35_13G068400 [Sphagnum magellanicum]
MWEAEKGELKSKEWIAADEHRKKLSHKNHYLQRKLKERNKVFATMTVEHNQLLIQLGEIETHLSITQTTKLVYA